MKKNEKPALPAPPECKTEAERTAYAFGWFKAMEHMRVQNAADDKACVDDPVALALYDAKCGDYTTIFCRSKISKVAALYTRPQPQAIPAGYALVPVEPTPEMIDAGQIPTRVVDLGNGTTTCGLGLGANPYSIYSAMIAAAPKVK